MNATLMPVEPVAPVARWLGGKVALATRIIELLREVPHVTYAEPFIGMGGIFLRRPFRARSEVINDANGEVVNLFRILQRHHQAFLDTLRWQLGSRAEFQRLRSVDPTTLTDLERAARFLYLQRQAYGGRPYKQSFSTAPVTSSRFDMTKLEPLLSDVHERLAGVVIECLPYPELIRRYDREETLFYLDPPYYGCETHYGQGLFERADFERLAAILAALQGKFLLSLNDCPEVRDLFGRFTISEVKLSYGVARGPRKEVGELLISG